MHRGGQLVYQSPGPKGMLYGCIMEEVLCFVGPIPGRGYWAKVSVSKGGVIAALGDICKDLEPSRPPLF